MKQEIRGENSEMIAPGDEAWGHRGPGRSLESPCWGVLSPPWPAPPSEADAAELGGPVYSRG